MGLDDMRLDETKEGLAWLEQFDIVHREVARQLLRKLVLVSASDFDTNIQLKIISVLASEPNENFALMSVPEPEPKLAARRETEEEEEVRRERRIPGSSSDRVKHIIENISRIYGNRVRANPTIESMRAERVRNVILVEDFVGSGTRLTGFWKDQFHKSIKSWISYGWTKLWVLAYAATEPGRAVLQRCMPLTANRMLTVLPERDPRLDFNDLMMHVARFYAAKFQLPKRLWWGYKDSGGSIIFQHGCPNNAPAILWKSKERFRPLFPDRGVPPGLHHCFRAANLHAVAEDLWTVKQYRLALSLLKQIPAGSAPIDDIRLVIALGFASSYGRWEDKKLQAQLMIPMHEVEALRYSAYRVSLIDKQDHRLTPFARDLLLRFKEAAHSKSKPAPKPLPQLTDLYYPQTCGGVAQR